MTQHQPAPRRARERGFTLVELLISVALGMLIMIALIAVYLNISRTNTEMAKTNSQIENGRFAVDIVQEDLSHAGFWGGFIPKFEDISLTTAPADAPASVPDPCLAYGSWGSTAGHVNALLGIPVQVHDSIPGNCSGIILDRKAGTDILVVRHAETCLPGEANCEALDNYKLYFQASFCATEIAASSTYVLSNTAGDFTLKKRNCSTVSEKRKFVSNIYYVRTYAVTAGDGIPTLMRASFGKSSSTPAHEAAVALIEGIEQFRVELGFDQKSRCDTDTDWSSAITKVDPSTCATNTTTATLNTMPTNRGDGVPETPYRHCTSLGSPVSPETTCTAAMLASTVSVKIYFVARSREASAGHTDSKSYVLGNLSVAAANDGYKRHVFQSTVRLHNVAGRRETP